MSVAEKWNFLNRTAVYIQYEMQAWKKINFSDNGNSRLIQANCATIRDVLNTTLQSDAEQTDTDYTSAKCVTKQYF